MVLMFLVFVGIHLSRPSPEEIQCKVHGRFVVSAFNGRVVEHFVDKANHAELITTIEEANGDRIRLNWSLERSNVFALLAAGVEVEKLGNQTGLRILTNGQDTTVYPDYGCKGIVSGGLKPHSNSGPE